MATMKKLSDEGKIFLCVLFFCLLVLGMFGLKHAMDTDWGKHPSNDQIDIFR
jgi:hypothetical protein